MNKLISIIYLIPLIHAWEEEIVIEEFSCKPRRGTITLSEDVPSEVSCKTGETLVSCGIDGWNNIKGTYIDQSDPKKCIAGQSLPLQMDRGVTAVAVCCKFPEDSIESVFTNTSTDTDENGVQVITQCPSDSTLTGCQVDFQSGNTGEIRGSYPGPQQGVNTKPLQSDDEPKPIQRATGNQCIAEALSDGTSIRGGAQCIKTAQCKNGYAYNLECVTTGTLTPKGSGNPAASAELQDDQEEGNFDGGCPTDFNLVACNVYTATADTNGHPRTPDDWYYTGNKACYVQQDEYDPLRATGICCKLTRVRCKDSDWDRVYDRFDECPYRPGPYYNYGCPECKQDGKGDNGKGQEGGSDYRDYRDYKGDRDTGRGGRGRERGSDGSRSGSYSYSYSGSDSSSSDSSSRGRRSRNRYGRDGNDEKREMEEILRKLEYEYRGSSKY